VIYRRGEKERAKGEERERERERGKESPIGFFAASCKSP